jgi:metallo-beta-lactamase class B
MRVGAKTASFRRTAIGLTAVILGILSSAETVASTVEPDPPVACTKCEAWNRPHEPFRVYGNTYYVGVAGLPVILIQG